MPGIALGCFLIFIALVLLAIKYNNKSSGVSLKDEWRETSTANFNAARQRNLVIGFIISVVVAYIVTGQPIITLIVGIGGAFLVANGLTNTKLKKNKELLEEQYIQVLNSIVSSLQGGANPYQALEETVTELKNPAREVFIEIIRRNRTGNNYSEAIRDVANEVGWDDLHQLEMAFRLYDRTGSNLVQVCNHLLQSAYNRRADRKYVAATTASIMTTTTVLSILPFFVMAFMRIVAPEFAAPLFNTAGGIIVLCIIVGMVAMGNKISKMMVNNLIG